VRGGRPEGGAYFDAARVVEFEEPAIAGTVWMSRPLPCTQYGTVLADPDAGVNVREVPDVE
jgi:hypothetical protein